MRPVSTFSIVGRCPETGDLGIAVASKFLAVGAVVPFAEADVGAVATQSYANTTYGPRTLTALRAGVPLDLVHEAFAATDDQHASRQYGLVDASGKSVSFTGEACQPWAGGIAGRGFAAQGNLLVGPEVVAALSDTFQAAGGPLADRLLAALQAGDRAGGDKRGRQGAALLVVRAGGGYGGFNDRYIDLRIDDHSAPVGRLHELLELHRLFFERPQERDLLMFEGEVRERVLAVLEHSGRHREADGWGEAAVRALQDLAGSENLEERLQGDDGIDRRALEMLERLYPG